MVAGSQIFWEFGSCVSYILLWLWEICLCCYHSWFLCIGKKSKQYVIWNCLHSIKKDSRCNCQCMPAISLLHVHITFRLLPFLWKFITPLMLWTECWEGYVTECVAGCRSVHAMQLLNLQGHSWCQLQVLSPHILKIFWTGVVLTGQCLWSMQKYIHNYVPK
jgi:hypothetical protein